MSFEKSWLSALQKTIFHKLGSGNGDCNVHGECDANLLYLKRWQSRQRNSFKNCELSPSKVMALHFAGFVFDLADEKWDTIFKRVSGKQVLSKKEKAWLKLQNDYFESGLLAVRRCLLLKNANLLESVTAAGEETMRIDKEAKQVVSDVVLPESTGNRDEWNEMFALAQQRGKQEKREEDRGTEKEGNQQESTNVSAKVADWLATQTYLFADQSVQTFDKDMKNKFVTLWPKEKQLVETLVEKCRKRSNGASTESDDNDNVADSVNNMEEEEETVSNVEDAPKETKSATSKKRTREEATAEVTAATESTLAKEGAPKRVSSKPVGEEGTLATLQKHSGSPALTTELLEILRNHDLHENTAELLSSLRLAEKTKLMENLSMGQRAALRIAFGIKL